MTIVPARLLVADDEDDEEFDLREVLLLLLLLLLLKLLYMLALGSFGMLFVKFGLSVDERAMAVVVATFVCGRLLGAKRVGVVGEELVIEVVVVGGGDDDKAVNRPRVACTRVLFCFSLASSASR